MFSLFVVAWNTRKYTKNRYLLFLGIAFLFVAILDLIHTFAYRGMGIFTGFSTNLPTQLWISARFLQAVSLVIAPAFIRRKLDPVKTFLAYLFVTILLVGSIFAGWFPVAYEDGLTLFKIFTEYVIIGLLIFAAYRLYRRRTAFGTTVFRLLMGGVILMVLSEIFFTLYVDVYGLFNFAGHIFKILEFYVFYLAILDTGLRRPFDLLFRDLQKSNRLKDMFIDIMRHDLLNPVGTVRGYTKLLKAKEKDAQKQEILASMEEESDRIIAMVENSAILAKLGEEELEFEDLDVADLIADAVREMQPTAKEKNVRLHKKVKSCMIQGNPLLRNVFMNLLANAIKYGPKNGRISIVMKKCTRIVRIEVSDDGRGIPADKKEQIFTRFERLEQGNVSGRGLGLAIAKKVGEAHGGRIWVEDNKPRGSRFIVEIPRNV